jgi:hypothetical protein
MSTNFAFCATTCPCKKSASVQVESPDRSSAAVDLAAFAELNQDAAAYDEKREKVIKDSRGESKGWLVECVASLAEFAQIVSELLFDATAYLSPAFCHLAGQSACSFRLLRSQHVSLDRMVSVTSSLLAQTYRRRQSRRSTASIAVTSMQQKRSFHKQKPLLHSCSQSSLRRPP